MRHSKYGTCSSHRLDRLLWVEQKPLQTISVDNNAATSNSSLMNNSLAKLTPPGRTIEPRYDLRSATSRHLFGIRALEAGQTASIVQAASISRQSSKIRFRRLDLSDSDPPRTFRSPESGMNTHMWRLDDREAKRAGRQSLMAQRKRPFNTSRGQHRGHLVQDHHEHERALFRLDGASMPSPHARTERIVTNLIESPATSLQATREHTCHGASGMWSGWDWSSGQTERPMEHQPPLISSSHIATPLKQGEAYDTGSSSEDMRHSSGVVSSWVTYSSTTSTSSGSGSGSASASTSTSSAPHTDQDPNYTMHGTLSPSHFWDSAYIRRHSKPAPPAARKPFLRRMSLPLFPARSAYRRPRRRSLGDVLDRIDHVLPLHALTFSQSARSSRLLVSPSVMRDPTMLSPQGRGEIISLPSTMSWALSFDQPYVRRTIDGLRSTRTTSLVNKAAVAQYGDAFEGYTTTTTLVADSAYGDDSTGGGGGRGGGGVPLWPWKMEEWDFEELVGSFG